MNKLFTVGAVVIGLISSALINQAEAKFRPHHYFITSVIFAIGGVVFNGQEQNAKANSEEFADKAKEDIDDYHYYNNASQELRVAQQIELIVYGETPMYFDLQYFTTKYQAQAADKFASYDENRRKEESYSRQAAIFRAAEIASFTTSGVLLVKGFLEYLKDKEYKKRTRMGFLNNIEINTAKNLDGASVAYTRKIF